MASQTTFINQLYKGRHAKKLVIRPIRIWNSYNTKKALDLISLDFVALDANNEAIHCCIRSRFLPDFNGLLKEGSVYALKNFVVDLEKPTYRVVRRDMYILMDASTYLQEIITNVPIISRHSFELVPFNDLPTMSNRLQNLCDVIGYVVGMSDVGKRVYDKKISKLQYVDIEDISKHRLRLTVWGEDMLKHLADVAKTKSRVWIITSTIVKVDGGVCLLSSSSATKFYYDKSIDEIEHFISSYDIGEGEQPISKIPMFNPFVTRKEYERGKKTITDVLDMLDSGSEFKSTIFVHGLIASIEEQNGWKYNSCKECKRKVHLIDGRLRCIRCEKDEPYPIIRYKVEFELEDNGKSLQCVMFDKEVEKLITLKAKAGELARLITEEEMEGSLPRQLRQIIGMKHIFQLTLNDQSLGTWKENFTVARILFETDIVDDDHNDKGKNVEIGELSGMDVKTPCVLDKKRLPEVSPSKDECNVTSADNVISVEAKDKEAGKVKRSKRVLQY